MFSELNIISQFEMQCDAFAMDLFSDSLLIPKGTRSGI